MADVTLSAESVRDNSTDTDDERDPFKRSEITRPRSGEKWDEDTWYTKIDVALAFYARAVARLKEPCIEPLDVAIRHHSLKFAIGDLASLGVTVGGDIGHA